MRSEIQVSALLQASNLPLGNFIFPLLGVDVKARNLCIAFVLGVLSFVKLTPPEILMLNIENLL